MSDVETIKDRLDIVDVVGTYVKLEKAGKNFRARCPFHNERTPSFNVSPDRQSYHCFGCGASGDMFSFVEQFEGVDFYGALKILADRAGVALEKKNPQAKDERDRLFLIMETACVFFQRHLLQHDDAKSYVTKRSVTEQTVRRWRIGYAPHEWRSLFDFLSKKGFTEKEMLVAGLVKKSDKQSHNGRFYDTFRDRIMFPIMDPSGRVIAFSGRALHSEEGTPKYLNSPDTPLFNKSEALFGLHFAKQAIREQGYCVIVEGQFDLIMSHQAGIVHTVASSGTALTAAHLSRIKKIAPRVIFAFDADTAGEKAAFRSSVLALGQGLAVKIAALPEGKDPAELSVDDGSAWKKVLREAAPVVEFFVDRALSKASAQDRNDYVRTIVLPLISSVPSSIDKAHLISVASAKLSIPEKALWEDLERAVLPEESREDLTSVRRVANEQLPEMLTKGEPARELFAILFAGNHTEEVTKNLKEILGETFGELEKSAEAIKDELLYEIERYEEGVTSTQLEELFLGLKDELLEGQIKIAQGKLSLAEKTDNDKEINELLTLCRDLAQQKEEISKKRQLLAS